MSSLPVKLRGPVLWQNFAAGMTTEEASAADPEVVPNASPDSLANGATSDLVLRDFELNGDRYSCNLYFKSGILSQVTLTCDEEANFPKAYDIITLMRAKYGPELSIRHPDNDVFLKILDAEWLRSDGVNINVACIEGITLNINYQTRMQTEANKI